MDLFLKNWASLGTTNLRVLWFKHGTAVLQFALALMAVVAILKLSDEFYRLTLDPSRLGANDLKLRYEEVHSWFTGIPVYNEKEGAVYPPASYPMLWPFLGWLNFTQARWLWAVTTIIMLVWLAYLAAKQSYADTTLERFSVALIPFSMNATGTGIGNGQLIVHIIPVLLAGFLILRRGRVNWLNDIIAAFLILVALVKPSVSAPFFWIVLFAPGRLRPAILVTLGYISLTLLAASFQELGLFSLLHDWLARASPLVSAEDKGYGNLPIWLTALGLKEWALPSSFLALLGLGVWTYFYRRVDLWLLLGVSAIVARLWTYHRWYDDLLILIPIITLFRIAKRGPSANGCDVIAALLLGITVLAMLSLYRLQYLLPSPWNLLITGGHAIVWITVLIFLLYMAWKETKNGFSQMNSSP